MNTDPPDTKSREAERQLAEVGREQAEAQRNAAEGQRQTAEGAREYAEELRQAREEMLTFPMHYLFVDSTGKGTHIVVRSSLSIELLGCG